MDLQDCSWQQMQTFSSISPKVCQIGQKHQGTWSVNTTIGEVTTLLLFRSRDTTSYLVGKKGIINSNKNKAHARL